MNLGALNDLTPVLNFASRAFSKPGDQWGPRLIPDCQFFHVISGAVSLQLGPQQYEILPGECVFYGEQSPHILKTLRDTEYFSLHFSWHGASPHPIHPAYYIRDVPDHQLDRRALRYQMELSGYGELSFPHHFTLPAAEGLMLRIVKEYQQEACGFPFLLRALLMELIMMMIGQAMDQPARARMKSKIEPALLVMREQPAKHWSVTELAGLCGYHPSYFTQLFFQEMGQNPKQYLIAERIKLAKQALLRGEPIESLAERLGYASIHYFSHNFKKETGLTPSQFRQLPDSSRSDSGNL